MFSIAATAYQGVQITGPENAGKVFVNSLTESRALISVLDADEKPVLGLKENDFSIRKGSKTGNILSVSSLETSEDVPLNIIVVADNSQSMKTRNAVKPLLNALEELYKIIRPIDNVHAIVFDDANTTTVQGYEAHAKSFNSSNVDELRTFFNKSFTEGLTKKTYLYDGMMLGLDRAGQIPFKSSKFLLVFTDGQDINSKANAAMVEDVAKDIPNLSAYALDFKEDTSTDYFLSTFSESHGGKIWKAESASELSPIFKSVSNRLKHQYVINYRFRTAPTGTVALEPKTVVSAQQQTMMGSEELFPPNAKPGQCFARVFVPPKYKTVTQEVLMKEGGSRLLTSEPEFENVVEEVMVQPPSTRFESVSAQYEWIEVSDAGQAGAMSGSQAGSLSEAGLLKLLASRYPNAVAVETIPATYTFAEERVLIQPEHKHLKPIPSVYEMVREQVLERPAHTIWKKGKGPIQRVDNATGEIMCLVKVPATYKTITKRVLKTPASTREEIVPAKYDTVKKKIIKTPAMAKVKVVKTPAHVREIEIPAKYKTVKVRKLVREAKTSAVNIEPTYQTVSKKEMITEGAMEWKPILCKTNISPSIIQSLQRALTSAGFNAGPTDGQLGMSTMRAVEAYQKSKGLARGELTIATLESLGIEY